MVFLFDTLQSCINCFLLSYCHWILVMVSNLMLFLHSCIKLVYYCTLPNVLLFMPLLYIILCYMFLYIILLMDVCTFPTFSWYFCYSFLYILNLLCCLFLLTGIKLTYTHTYTVHVYKCLYFSCQQSYRSCLCIFLF